MGLRGAITRKRHWQPSFQVSSYTAAKRSTSPQPGAAKTFIIQIDGSCSHFSVIARAEHSAVSN